MAARPIRILHTADWHLGREFYGRSLADRHEAFFDWLADQVESREVDLLLMAGDIFDRALPPGSATGMFNRRMAELSELTRVVAITGNHDSVVRMSHGPLLKPSIELRAGIDRLAEPLVIEGDFPLAVYPIPYLHPPVMAEQLGLEEASHEAVLGEAVRRCREDLAGRPGNRAVALAHAFITGAETSDLERDIQVGGSAGVPASVFEGFDYVALGHLHRPQALGERIRYSGSPIPLSFSEVGSGAPKSVNLVELAADGAISQEQIEIPQTVKMARIKGSLEQLLADPQFDGLEDAWLEITLTDKPRPDRPKDRLRSRFKGLIQPRFDAPLLVAGETPEAAKIRKLDAREVVDEFLRHIRGPQGEPDEAERELLDRAFASPDNPETGA